MVSRWVVMVRALLGELTICIGDGCANRSADEAGWATARRARLSETTTHRTESVTSAEVTGRGAVRGLTTLPDVKCLGR